MERDPDLGDLPDDGAELWGEEDRQAPHADRVLARQHLDDTEVQRVRARFVHSKFAR